MVPQVGALAVPVPCFAMPQNDYYWMMNRVSVSVPACVAVSSAVVAPLAAAPGALSGRAPLPALA